MKTHDFTDGMSVIYIPNHAQGDIKHRDVEYGVVTSVNDSWVFVNFPPHSGSKACDPKNLVPGT